MNKSNVKKLILILVILVVIGICGYIIYINLNNKETPDKEYILSKFIETDSKIMKDSSIKVSNNFIFFNNSLNYPKSEDYLEIYNKNGMNVTPKEIKNTKLNSISVVEINDEFLGYTVNTYDKKGYYINNEGKIIFELETASITNMENYILSDSDKICYTYNFEGYKGEYPCIKIYDLKGDLLINGEIENYYSPSIVYNKNNDTIFAVRKDGQKGLIDKKGNIIIDFKYVEINFNESKNILIARKSQTSEDIDIYDLKGNLLSQIFIKDIEIIKENATEFGGTIVSPNRFELYLNDSLYLIDNNYELKKYDNVAWTPGPAASAKIYNKKFIATNYIYIKNNNNSYTVHDLKGNKLIDTEFKFVGNANGGNGGAIGVPNGYITLCKNVDKTECGAIDLKGNIILNFDNEIYGYYEKCYEEDGEKICFTYQNGFKNENQYFDIVDGKITKKITCDNLNNIYIDEYLKNTITIKDKNVSSADGGNKIIDYNCNSLSEAKYYNIYEYDNFILAQNKDMETYDIYDTYGNIINYENKDNGKIYNLLGYNEGKLYFGYQNNIYILTEK